MAKTDSDAYERGRRNGSTDATLEGIADALDRIQETIVALPCQDRGGAIGRLEGQVKGIWIAIGMIGSATIGGLVALVKTIL